ncbi:cysteine hydrolase family protein [Lentibacillus jeotgali]|uniref:cysteine hydrolase family protein n=1 Tax=Lentibacillus jeotgali TaxID=558169 RepID=UPI0002627834|nr:isochorismatase family cysteine hydrolase [Lentibacillus jeotgali]
MYEEAEEKVRESLFDRKTALVLIDLQNDFCHLDGTASKRGKSITNFQDTFKSIVHLLNVARRENIPIIHTISEHSVWSQSPSRKERFGRQEQKNTLSYCQPGTWGANIYHLFEPEPNEKVIIKHRYSAFLYTNLELILRASQIEHIILVGIYTNVCIDSTARDGYMRDFCVTVPYDCVASDDEEKHEYALHLLKGTFANIVHSSKLIEQ